MKRDTRVRWVAGAIGLILVLLVATALGLGLARQRLEGIEDPTAGRGPTDVSELRLLVVTGPRRDPWAHRSPRGLRRPARFEQPARPEPQATSRPANDCSRRPRTTHPVDRRRAAPRARSRSRPQPPLGPLRGRVSRPCSRKGPPSKALGAMRPLGPRSASAAALGNSCCPSDACTPVPRRQRSGKGGQHRPA